jgi:hypothetical protein
MQAGLERAAGRMLLEVMEEKRKLAEAGDGRAQRNLDHWMGKLDKAVDNSAERELAGLTAVVDEGEAANQLNVGIDTELAIDGMTLAGYHIEAGARKYADYVKAMVDDMGEAVRPYLRSWYEAVRYHPELDTDDLSSSEEIEREMSDASGTPVGDESAASVEPAVVADVDPVPEPVTRIP